MDHETTNISFPGWHGQWLQRTHEGLALETQTVALVLCAIALLESIVTSYYSISTHRALKRNPSDRAAIFAENEKRMLKPSRVLFFLSYVCLFHSLGIWLTDAAIGIFAIAKDVDSNPEHYDAALWLNLAIHCVVMLGIFLSVFIIFPALQMVGMGYALARFYRRNETDGTLSAYITPLRHASSNLAFVWNMLGFLIVVWWPVFEHTTMRVILLEAVFGSALTWLHASFLFTFKGPQIEHVDVQQILGVQDGMKLYGQQVYAVHSGKNQAGLPTYEGITETAPLISEKSAQ